MSLPDIDGALVVATIGKTLLSGAVGALSAKVKARLLGPETRRALDAVVAEAVEQALHELPPRVLEPTRAALQAWAARPAVHAELAGLLRLDPDEPSLDTLWAEWACVDPEELVARPDFDRFCARFLTAFSDRAVLRPELSQVLACQSLRQIADTLARSSQVAVRAEAHAARATDLLAEIRALLDGQSATQAEILARLQGVDRGEIALVAGLFRLLSVHLGHDGPDDASGPLAPYVRELREVLQRATPAQHAELEAVYRGVIAEGYARLEYGSMDGKPVAVDLEDVYVPLHVVSGEPGQGETFSTDERRALALDAEGQEATEARQQAIEAAQQERLRRATERRSLDELLQTEARLVVLGDPGSGKSTALRRRLLDALRDPGGRLPVLVPLAAYEAHRREGGAADLFQFLGAYLERWWLQPGLEPLLRVRFKEGRLLLLLDGLDEVVERDTRVLLAQLVGVVAGRATEVGSQVVVSSRFVGYREAPVRGMPLYAVVPLSLGDIEAFAGRFSASVARLLIADPTEAQAQAQRDSRALLRDVKSKPGVRELATNPLLLTQLALLRREVGTLPDRRVLLYERFLDKLLSEWRHQRSQGVAPGGELNTVRTLKALAVLAFEMQQGRRLGIASEEQVLDILEKSLRHQGEPQPAHEAAQLLVDVRRRAGVLVERGHKVYGFLHLTFQEFLAGRTLARKGAVEAWHFLKERVHDPPWREPLFLALGWLSLKEQRDEDAAELMQRILDAGSPHEDLLYRDLFLASELAAEEGAYGPLRQTLVLRLAPLLESDIPAVGWEAARRLAMLARAGEVSAEDRLCAWLSTPQSRRNIVALAPFLHAPGCRRVRDQLRSWLDDDQDWQTAKVLAETLSQDTADLERLVTWVHHPRERPVPAVFVWSAIARHLGESPDIRAAVLHELRREGAQVVLPPAEVLPGDPELSLTLFDAWSLKGGHSAEDLARALGKALLQQGVPASRLLAPLRGAWPRSGLVVPAFEAYATDPEVRAFLWSVAGDQGGEPHGWALRVLAIQAGDHDVDRMLAGVTASLASGRAQWGLALQRVPQQDRVAGTLARLIEKADDAVRLVLIRAGVATAADADLIRWFRRDNWQIREVLAPELGRRIHQPQLRGLLVEGVRTPAEHPSAKAGAWTPLAALYERDAQARAALDAAIDAEDVYACRALALQPGVRETVRLRALEHADYLIPDTLWEGGDELIALASASPHAASFLRRTLRGRSVKAAQVRGALVASLLPQLGPEDLLDVAGEDGLLYVLGDIYDALDEEDQVTINQRWAEPGTWGVVAPPVSVPAVRETLVEGVRRSALWCLRWAALLGSDLHDSDGVTEALRAACMEPSAETAAAAVECLGLRSPLDAEDVGVLLDATRSEDLQVRCAAVQALVSVARQELVRARLIDLLQDRDAPVRHWSAAILAVSGGLSPWERCAWLGVALDDLYMGQQWNSSEVTRCVVAQSLSEDLASDDALYDHVVSLLDNPCWSVRQGAALALVHVRGRHPSAARLLQALQDLHDDRPTRDQIACARSLLGAPSTTEEALAVRFLSAGARSGLAPWRDARDTEVERRLCIRALGEADTLVRHDVAVHALKDALHDPSPDVRTDAWLALRRVLSAPVALDGRS